MNFQIVPVSDVDRFWPRLAEGFGKVCKRARNLTLADLYQRARTGNGHLLVAFDDEIRGAAICVPEEWADGPKINVIAFWGDDFRTWRGEFMDAVRALGKLCGTDTAIFSGPAAYRRLFPTARVIRQTFEVK